LPPMEAISFLRIDVTTWGFKCWAIFTRLYLVGAGHAVPLQD
jgi:hypothetical protein